MKQLKELIEVFFTVYQREAAFTWFTCAKQAGKIIVWRTFSSLPAPQLARNTLKVSKPEYLNPDKSGHVATRKKYLRRKHLYRRKYAMD